MKKLDTSYTFWFPLGAISLFIFMLHLMDSKGFISTLLSSIFGLILLALGIYRLRKIYSLKNWKEYSASIVNSNCEKWLEVDRWIKTNTYSPNIEYSYNIGKETFTSRSYALFQATFQDTVTQNGKEMCQKLIAAYPLGKIVPVFVNPKQYGESVLDISVHWNHYFKYTLLVILGSIFLTLAVV